MTKEDKKLLLKDLATRLPYGVKVKTPYNDAILIGLTKRMNYIDVITDKQTCPIRYIKPYLRSMSSMTEEEKETYRIIIKSLLENSVTNNIATLYNFLNSKYLDYNGLIPLGFAIEVTEENNPYIID